MNGAFDEDGNEKNQLLNSKIDYLDDKTNTGKIKATNLKEQNNSEESSNEKYKNPTSSLSSSKETGIEITKESLFGYTMISISSSLISLISIFSIETINLNFIGNTNNSSINLMTVGIGNIYINITSLFLMIGSLGGLQTIGTLLYGQKNYQEMGLYTIRMRIILILFYFILSVSFAYFSEDILIKFNFDAEIAKLTGDYIFNMLPAIFFLFNLILNIRYIQIMQEYFLISIVSISTLMIHYYINLFWYANFNFDCLSVAYTTSISTFIGLTISAIYIVFNNPNENTLIFFHENLLSLKELFYLSKLGFLSGIQYFSDNAGYQIITFTSIYLCNSNDTSACVILLNYLTLISLIYSSSSYPISQLVSYSMGKNDEDFYDYVVSTYIKFNFVVGGFISLIVLSFGKNIIRYYTDNDNIDILAYPILVYIAMFSLVDNFNIMYQGILKGSGNPHIPSVWNLIGTLFICFPSSYLLAFHFGYNLLGLWMGIFLNMLVMLIINFIYYYCFLDFKDCVEFLNDEIE